MSFNGSGVFQINTAGQPVVSGTVISSTAFNALTADLATGLSTCVTKDGQTTPTANIPMANYKFTGLGAGTDAGDSANLGQVQSTVVKLIGSVSGTNTITGSLTPALTAYAAGQMFYFVAAGDNTGAVTLNINSLGAKNVTKDGATALSAAEIKSGQTVVVVYDGTRFQMVNPVVVGLTGITTATNTALGVGAGDSVTSGSNNTSVGVNAGTAMTSATDNTVVGYNAGTAITNASSNVFIGGNAGAAHTTQQGTVAIGYNAASLHNRASNTYVGTYAGYNADATGNTAVGYFAGQGGVGASGGSNVAVGFEALKVYTTGGSNTAVGTNASNALTTANWNTTVGSSAGDSVTTGNANTFVGYAAGGAVTTNSLNSALGDTAYATGNYQNSTCLGYDSAVTGDNQVQLGNSSTTSYAYGAVVDRASDIRDKADVQDTNLGLNFIMELRPVMYRWDYREDYRPPMPKKEEYEIKEEYQAAKASWQEACKLSNLTHDGTHKRNRLHQGLIAQEVKSVMDSLGTDFGGYKDGTIDGGDDRVTLAYGEFIAPLIKAIQELKAEFDAYKATHP